MSLWGVNLDSISMITLMICTGLGVDYPAHVSYCYVANKGKCSKEMVRKTLYSLGLPITQAACSTIAGVLVLSVAPSYIFGTFFKVIFLVISLSYLHSLILLPVLLSIFNPSQNEISYKLKGKQRYDCGYGHDNYGFVSQELPNTFNPSAKLVRYNANSFESNVTIGSSNTTIEFDKKDNLPVSVEHEPSSVLSLKTISTERSRIDLETQSSSNVSSTSYTNDCSTSEELSSVSSDRICASARSPGTSTPVDLMPKHTNKEKRKIIQTRRARPMHSSVVSHSNGLPFTVWRNTGYYGAYYDNRYFHHLSGCEFQPRYHLEQKQRRHSAGAKSAWEEKEESLTLEEES